MKNRFWIALPLAATLTLPALAQQNSPSSQNASQPANSVSTPAAPQWQNNQSQSNTQTTDTQSQSNPQAAATPSADQSSDQQVNHEPLKLETHEGFWGKINPFARKKYVQRQLGPVTNRVNELDELTAKNSKDIRDVDARAQQGIQMADSKATQADQHAVQAGQTAQQAQQTAQQANQQLTTVSSVVNNIDQYKPITTAEIRFRSGQTMLSKKAKDALDQMAGNLKDQRGYIVEIQGFSSGRGAAGIEHSQRMAEAVRRYLVVNNDVPVYRVHVLGMGNAPMRTENGETERVRGTTVEVSLLKNDLEQLSANSGTQSGSMAPAEQQNQQAQPMGAPATQQQNVQPQSGIGAPTSQQPATSTPPPASTEKPSAISPKR
jgi:outer membrane protein OmpA-like peptidoglycan-associated protein